MTLSSSINQDASRRYCPPEQLELTELFGDNSIGDEKEVTYSFRHLQRLVLHFGQLHRDLLSAFDEYEYVLASSTIRSLTIHSNDFYDDDIEENETLHLKTRLERLELLDCHIQVSVFQRMLLQASSFKGAGVRTVPAPPSRA